MFTFKIIVDDLANLIVNALTATGTLSAVIATIYLARKDNSTRLNAYCHIVKYSQMYGSITKDTQSYLAINATNISRRSTRVTNFGFRFGLFKKKYWLQLLDFADPLNPRMPLLLNDGEEFHCRIPLDVFINATLEIIYPRCTSRAWTYVQLRSLRVAIYTSSSGVFYGKFGKDLIALLAAKINEMRSGEVPAPQDNTTRS